MFIEFGGAIYRLISELAQQFEGDVVAGTTKENYLFTKASSLALRLNIDEPSLRTGVARSRKKIEQSFAEKFGHSLDTNDVIQNQEWKGYRLNPHLLLSWPAQLRDQKGPVSRLKPQDVTTSVPGR